MMMQDKCQLFDKIDQSENGNSSSMNSGYTSQLSEIRSEDMKCLMYSQTSRLEM